MHGMPTAPQPASVMEVEDRTAPRFTLLIRAAKLVVEEREYLCVVRDVSASGVRIRNFHPIAEGTRLALEFQCGLRHSADLVWQRDSEAGLKFRNTIKVDDILSGYSAWPRRDLRFAVDLPAMLHTRDQSAEATIINLSRQGGAILCPALLSLEQPVRLALCGFPEIEAQVRWRRDGVYGLVFHHSFSIGNFALMIRDLHNMAVSWPRPTAPQDLETCVAADCAENTGRC